MTTTIASVTPLADHEPCILECEAGVWRGLVARLSQIGTGRSAVAADQSRSEAVCRSYSFTGYTPRVPLATRQALTCTHVSVLGGGFGSDCIDS